MDGDDALSSAPRGRSVTVATILSGLGGATVAVADWSQAGCSFSCGVSCEKIHDEPFVQRPLTKNLHTGAEVVVLEELSPFPLSTGEHMDCDDALSSAPRGRAPWLASMATSSATEGCRRLQPPSHTYPATSGAQGGRVGRAWLRWETRIDISSTVNFIFRCSRGQQRFLF